MCNEDQTKLDAYDWVLSPEIRDYMRTARPLTVEEKADIIDGGCRPIEDKYAALSKPFSCSRFAQRKKVDDGYRAIHLYYQRDNLAYPIEVQLWCGKDYAFNVWSHQYVYKYKTPEIGKTLYQEYSAGIIRTEHDFLAQLRELEAI